MLNLCCIEAADRLTIQVNGELAIETVEQFETATAGRAAIGRSIELDCRCLSFIDSTGVSALMKAVLGWQSAGLSVTISNLSNDLNEMLGVLGFFEVIGGPA